MDSLRDDSTAHLPVFPTRTPGLSVMPVGRRGDSDVAFEDISNGAFEACMDRLRKQYKWDIILLDGPPLLPVADASILAGQVNGTIMVEREGLSQRTHVADALARLGRIRRESFGNRVHWFERPWKLRTRLQLPCVQGLQRVIRWLRPIPRIDSPSLALTLGGVRPPFICRFKHESSHPGVICSGDRSLHLCVERLVQESLWPDRLDGCSDVPRIPQDPCRHPGPEPVEPRLCERIPRLGW